MAPVDMLFEDASKESAEDYSLVFGLAGELVDRLGFESKREFLGSELFVDISLGLLFDATDVFLAELFALHFLPGDVALWALVVLLLVWFSHGIFLELNSTDFGAEKGQQD